MVHPRLARDPAEALDLQPIEGAAMPTPFRSALVALILLAAAAAPGARADEGPTALDRVTQRGVLEVAVYADFPPFSYRDKEGRPAGIDVDLARALAERLGVAAGIRSVGAGESVEDDLRNNVWKGHYLGGGVADLMLHVPYDEAFGERNDKVALIAPYCREQIVVAVPAGHPGAEAPLDLFTREKVGVELDTLVDFYLLAAQDGAMREQVVHFRNPGEAVAALRRGELTGVAGPRSEIEAALGADRAAYAVGPIQMPGLRLSGWDLGGAVKRDHRELAQAIERAMVAVRDSGEVERIFQRHGASYQLPSRIPRGDGQGASQVGPRFDPGFAPGGPSPALTGDPARRNPSQ